MRRFVESNDSPHYRELIRNMLAEPPTDMVATNQTLVAV
jgi:hypothetical protein